jgi:hypothetical protein
MMRGGGRDTGVYWQVAVGSWQNYSENSNPFHHWLSHCQPWVSSSFLLMGTGLFLHKQNSWVAKLTANLHLVPRMLMFVELYLHSPYIFIV